MNHLEQKFEKMGAKVQVRSQAPRILSGFQRNQMGSGAARLNVITDSRGKEYFDINIFGDSPTFSRRTATCS
jgi:hypothetical protein